MLRIIEIYEHSIDTVRHSDRVATITNLMGKEMGFPENELAVLWRSSLLHDLGKIGIVSKIIRGKRRLRPFERLAINQHPQWGSDIIKILGFFNYEAFIIKHHHENYDGTGYPDQLVGKRIHIFARIIHIADVYDALISFRTYRLQWFPNRAIAYMMKKSGSYFDPDLVKVFMKISEEDRFRSLYG
jgi:HD-GYP domain-containing protein (c-di-GMP phosphodiesterase class II)